MASFNGWADAWGNSWGSTVTDPNAMVGSASFSITGALQVASGEMQGSASFEFSATLTLPEPTVGGGSYEEKKKRVLKQIEKLNRQIIAKETTKQLVKAISKQAKQQVNEEDEDEVLMLLMSL